MYAERRAYVNSVEETVNKLKTLGAEFKGTYTYTDYIYNQLNKDINFNNHMTRIRKFKNQTIAELAHKGKKLTVTWPFESFSKAENSIKETHKFAFGYECQGHEFYYKDCKIYVEDIVSLPSSVNISTSSENSQAITEIFNLIKVKEVLKDSVPTLMIMNRMYKF